jgi:hypothetical protein
MYCDEELTVELGINDVEEETEEEDELVEETEKNTCQKKPY